MPPLSQRLKPTVSRRALIFIAAFVWAVAAWRVLLTASHLLLEPGGNPCLGLLEGLAGFPVFFALVFKRVARRHSRRIARLRPDRPCAFSFFDLKGYVVMAFMILLGVGTRVLHLLPPTVLGPFYVSLGLSLLGSSMIFAHGGLRWSELRRQHADG